MPAVTSTLDPAPAPAIHGKAAPMLLLLGTMGLLNPLWSDMLIPVLPALQTDLRASASQAQQVVSLFLLASAFMALWQGVLADADRVHAATLFTYQRGGATLLEVLNAQRTVDEIYLAYYQSLADHARQLIAVEQAAGLWDITLE